MVSAAALMRFGKEARPVAKELCEVTIRDSNDPFRQQRVAGWLRRFAPELLEEGKARGHGGVGE